MLMLVAEGVDAPPVSLASPGEHWLFTFTPWDRLHLISFAIGVSVIVGLSWLGLRVRGTPAEDRLRRMWGAWIMATWLAVNIIWLSPWKFDLATSLPLQICDWAGFWAGMVCLTRWHWPRVLLYFWGIGLSTQAFITPTVRDGIDSFDYWQFWINHTQIVATAFFDVMVRRYGPSWRDWAFAVVGTVAYAMAMLGFNMLVKDANYVYVGDVVPKNPTLIDKLGEWPWRILPLAGIVISAFTLLTLVWQRNRMMLIRRISRRQASAELEL